MNKPDSIIESTFENVLPIDGIFGSYGGLRLKVSKFFKVFSI